MIGGFKYFNFPSSLVKEVIEIILEVAIVSVYLKLLFPIFPYSKGIISLKQQNCNWFAFIEFKDELSKK